MTKEEMTGEDYRMLVDSILSIMMKNGISATTMDNIASTLKISKRTLYEIFLSKEQLVGVVLESFIRFMTAKQKEIAGNSSNSIEALLKIFIFSRKMLQEINLEFYKDMDQFYSLSEKVFESTELSYNMHMLELIRDGIRNGLVRDDIDYLLMYRMMLIQMNFLKQMDKSFPRDISMFDVYDTICLGFMRGIASPAGLRILDSLLSQHQELVRRSQLA